MTKLIVANWKMNGDLNKINHDLNYYVNSLYTNKSNVILALPDIYLAFAHQYLIKNSNIRLAAQDVSQYKDNGAYTGMVSAGMLKDCGVEYVIIGHSERRKYLNEQGKILADKVKNTLDANMVPIFCIGESLANRQEKNYLAFIKSQLDELNTVIEHSQDVIIAYEPCWSIGTGQIPTSYEIHEVTDFIYRYMQDKLAYVKITVLYGGSVNSQNANAILTIPGTGGLLVGGMSLNVADFSAICKNI